MLAIFYLILMLYLGDRVCRLFFRFSSLQHRLATSFLVGFLISSCLTYVISLCFSFTSAPILFGNIGFLLVLFFLYFLPKKRASGYLSYNHPRPTGSWKWELLFLTISLIFGSWMMFATLNYWGGNFQIGFAGWSDFGANLSLAQSFALGNNFPTEHPFFPFEPIKYHFLFWFQAANLSYLGLNLVWGVNLLSLLSLMALLVMIMTLAELLFKSRAVGRLSVVFFFFASSSLSYLPFLASRNSLIDAIESIWNLTAFLGSGFPYRGEDWGALSFVVYANQRHLISGVGILFVVLGFLIDFYNYKSAANEQLTPPGLTLKTFLKPTEGFRREIWTFIFSGLLIGLLPFWNGAVFVCALIILGSLFLLFPFRHHSAVLIVTASIIAFPQVLILKSGNLDQTAQTFFRFGYTIPEPTLWLVVQYLGWTFGLKIVFILISLWLVSGEHRRFFLAITSLIVCVFVFQFSTDVFNNHKLLNVWAIFASMFAAYAFWYLGGQNLLQTSLAVILVLVMIFGSIIDYFPIKNSWMLTVPHKNDRLTDWIFQNTKPSDVFLSQALLTHPILFTGRKVFLGNTLFAYTAGYNVNQRERIYKEILTERDVPKLLKLLRANKISYVAFDAGLRGNDLVKANLNEMVFAANFERVFVDSEEKYAQLIIYKVPKTD